MYVCRDRYAQMAGTFRLRLDPMVYSLLLCYLTLDPRVL